MATKIEHSGGQIILELQDSWVFFEFLLLTDAPIIIKNRCSQLSAQKQICTFLFKANLGLQSSLNVGFIQFIYAQR